MIFFLKLLQNELFRNITNIERKNSMSKIMKRRMAECLALSVGLSVMGMTPSSIYAAETKEKVALIDINQHWAYDSIETLIEAGVLTGYSDGTFRPNANITRAEMAVCLQNIFGFKQTNSEVFNDLDYSKNVNGSYNDWATDSILAVSDIMNHDGLAFRSDEYATREEVAYAIANAFSLAENGNVQNLEKLFSDSNEIAPWAKQAINQLVSKQYLSGRPDGTFDPKGHISRGELASILDRIAVEVVANNGVHKLGRVAGNVVISAMGNTGLQDTVIIGNLYIPAGVGNGQIFLDNVEVRGTVFFEGGNLILENTKIETLIVNNEDTTIKGNFKSEVEVADIRTAANIDGQMSIHTVVAKSDHIDIEDVPFKVTLEDAYKIVVADQQLYEDDIDSDGRIIFDEYYPEVETVVETVTVEPEYSNLDTKVEENGDITISNMARNASSNFKYALAQPDQDVEDLYFLPLIQGKISYQDMIMNYAAGEYVLVIQENLIADGDQAINYNAYTKVPIALIEAPILTTTANDGVNAVNIKLNRGIIVSFDDIACTINNATVPFTQTAIDEGGNLTLTASLNSVSDADLFSATINYPSQYYNGRENVTVVAPNTFQANASFEQAPTPSLAVVNTNDITTVTVAIPRSKWQENYKMSLDAVRLLNINPEVETVPGYLDLTAEFRKAYHENPDANTISVVVSQARLDMLPTTQINNDIYEDGLCATVSGQSSFVLHGTAQAMAKLNPTTANPNVIHNVNLGTAKSGKMLVTANIDTIAIGNPYYVEVSLLNELDGKFTREIPIYAAEMENGAIAKEIDVNDLGWKLVAGDEVCVAVISSIDPEIRVDSKTVTIDELDAFDLNYDIATKSLTVTAQSLEELLVTAKLIDLEGINMLFPANLTKIDDNKATITIPVDVRPGDCFEVSLALARPVWHTLGVSAQKMVTVPPIADMVDIDASGNMVIEVTNATVSEIRSGEVKVQFDITYKNGTVVNLPIDPQDNYVSLSETEDGDSIMRVSLEAIGEYLDDTNVSMIDVSITGIANSLAAKSGFPFALHRAEVLDVIVEADGTITIDAANNINTNDVFAEIIFTDTAGNELETFAVSEINEKTKLWQQLCRDK